MNNEGVTGYQGSGGAGYHRSSLASIVIDDLFQTNLAVKAGSSSLWDLGRIEVLRGAQSTNQGVNSLAGSVLLDHKAPTLSNEEAAKLGFGSFQHREIGMIANNVLLEDKAAVRVSYDKEMNGGYIKNIATGNNNWGQWNRDRVGLGLLYKISDANTLNLNGKFNRNDQGGSYVQGKDPFKYEVNEDQDFNTTMTNYQLGATHVLTLSEKTDNTMIFGLSKSDGNLFTDADGTPQNTAGTRLENNNDHYFSFENRLLYKTDKINNLFGVHTHDYELKDDFDFTLLFPLGRSSVPVAVRQPIDQTRRAYAIFNSFTYLFNENHSAIAGLRGEFTESKHGTSISGKRLKDLGSSTNKAIDDYIAKIFGTYGGIKPNFVLLPKIGYIFTTGPHHSGLTYTRGYRTAGVSVNRARAAAVEFDPEFTDNYEASYKYSSEGFQFSSNIFYIDWQDQQVQVQVQLSKDFYDTQVQNAAKAEVYGAEAEGRFRLTPHQALTAGVGYLDTKFKEFKTTSDNYEGKQFPFASHWTARLSHELKPTDNFSFFTILRNVSESYTNSENTRMADAQVYLDWNTKYVLRSSWIIEGYVNNVLDGNYRVLDGSPMSATSPIQTSYHRVSTPRELGMRLNYYW